MGRRLGELATLVRFGLLALVPIAALGALLGYELNADVQQRYLNSAQTGATLIATVGVQPLLNHQQVVDGLTTFDVAALEDKLQGGLVSNQVRRIKVWNRNGTVIYSDNHALIGRTFPIDDDLQAALGGTPKASITDGHDEENTGDNLAGPLVQVYVPLTFQGDTSPSGAFELYLPYAPVQAAINSETHQLYVLLALGLGLFYASMFPIVFFANRWRRQAETTALANLAVLERLNKLKTEFLIRISHQFRTSLVGIEGFTEVMRDSEQLDLDEVKSFAREIHDDAQRLERSFAEMLELDQLEAGRSILHLERTDINQLIEQAVRETGRPARIESRLDTSAPVVECDRERILQVLANLLSNALKFSRPRTQVLVSSAARGSEVTVTVADHGPGMPPDYDAKLFVGKANGSGSSSTGLGLPLARQIVEMHGGRIWFDSSPGQGSEFHFSLPVKAKVTRELKPVSAA